MNTLLTLNYLIEQFRTFANDHANLNDFVFGNFHEQMDVTYPLLNVRLDQPSYITQSNNRAIIPQLGITFNVIDRINPNVQSNANGYEGTNETFIYSDSYQTIIDFITYVRKTLAPQLRINLRSDDIISLDPITEFINNDNTCGWSADMLFTLEYLNCYIPGISSMPSPTPSIEILIDVNSTSFTSILNPSTGTTTVNIPVVDDNGDPVGFLNSSNQWEVPTGFNPIDIDLNGSSFLTNLTTNDNINLIYSNSALITNYTTLNNDIILDDQRIRVNVNGNLEYDETTIVNFDEVINLTIPADEYDITLNSASFLTDINSNDNITLEYSNSALITNYTTLNNAIILDDQRIRVNVNGNLEYDETVIVNFDEVINLTIPADEYDITLNSSPFLTDINSNDNINLIYSNSALITNYTTLNNDIILSDQRIRVNVNSNLEYDVTSIVDFDNIINLTIPADEYDITLNSSPFLTDINSNDNITLEYSNSTLITNYTTLNNAIILDDQRIRVNVNGNLEHDETSIVNFDEVINLTIPADEYDISINGVLVDTVDDDTNFFVKDQNGNQVGSLVTGEWIVNIPNMLNSYFYYDVDDDVIEVTIDANGAGTITNVTHSLSGFNIEVNGISVSTPFSLSNGDTIKFEFTSATSAGAINISGTY